MDNGVENALFNCNRLNSRTRYPGANDLLLGRGGETNNHSGNIQFRRLIEEYKAIYQSATKAQKPEVAALLVQHWRDLDPPGRFLAKSQDDDEVWEDIGDLAARRRASKSLGERSKRPNSVSDTNQEPVEVDPSEVRRVLAKRRRVNAGSFAVASPMVTTSATATGSAATIPQQALQTQSMETLFPPLDLGSSLPPPLQHGSSPGTGRDSQNPGPSSSTLVSERLFTSMRPRPVSGKQSSSLCCRKQGPQSVVKWNGLPPGGIATTATTLPATSIRITQLKPSAVATTSANTIMANDRHDTNTKSMSLYLNLVAPIQVPAQQQQTPITNSISNVDSNQNDAVVDTEENLSSLLEGIPTAADLTESFVWDASC